MNDFPILQLNNAGLPVRWVNYDTAVMFYAKDQVLWEIGDEQVVYRGGYNRLLGEQSRITMRPIIAIKRIDGMADFSKMNTTPRLTNRTLFNRDQNLCAYCGQVFGPSQLTRDHVIPRSRGGQDVWTNVVTACSRCNCKKDSHTPEEAGMPLLYVPYAPTHHEQLILAQARGRILGCQMEFLLAGINPNSRIHKQLQEVL